jgi:hypothetical protein
MTMDSHEWPDNGNRKNLSALLKDISDERRKKLRVKTVAKVLKDVRGMLFSAAAVGSNK